jgi:large subunit ribosomal protein L13
MDYHIDAKGKILGRLASDVALVLQGKKSASYQPNRIGSDRAVVKNIADVKVTGNKLVKKIYRHHTGYVGHLKELRLEEKMAKDPRVVLRTAVRKMLPKNFLNQKRMKNLVFMEEKK